MTVQDAFEINRAMQQIDLGALGGEARLAFARTHREVQRRCEEARKVASEIRREHAETGEDGEIVTDERDTPVVADNDAYEADIDDLMESEVDVPRVEHEYWQSLGMDALALLEPILTAE